jgi:hypothetical protein
MSATTTVAPLAAEIEKLKHEKNNLKRCNILWIFGLVTVIVILVSVGGGLAGKFIHQDKNSSQGSITSSGTGKVNSFILAMQLTGRTVWTEFAFVTQVSSAGGSAIYSTVTTSEPIILTDQSSPNSVTNTIAATTIITVPPIQGNWRYCQNCHSMFYNGFSSTGVCVHGGGHVAAGFNFDLPHDIPSTASTQEQWRFCKNCFVMFYNGDTDKGTCATGGGHVADGYVFVLPHDIPSTTSTQDQWRYCSKCHTMFYDGYPDKGLCALSGGHVSSGFNFVLPHDLLT